MAHAGTRRLLREAAELARAGPADGLRAAPLPDNLFEWHFTVRGAPGSDFAAGVYHGRILLPDTYPMRPPHIILLTPNGRFEVNKKICLSISGHHPETWQPSWSIRTALVALVAFMPTPAEGTVGSLDYSPAERRLLARRSTRWACDHCGPVAPLLECSSDAEPEISIPEPPTVPPPPPQLEASEDHLRRPRDCIILCLVLSFAIFIYRRFNVFSFLTDLL